MLLRSISLTSSSSMSICYQGVGTVGSELNVSIGTFIANSSLAVSLLAS